MSGSNRLNSEELQLIQNSSILHIKNSALDKVYNLLSDTLIELKSHSNRYSLLPKPSIDVSGKVSKGENYLGLPYMVLDYPASFDLEDIFAYRTMFWWGNFYSCTLHLQGTYLDHFRDVLHHNYPLIKSSGIYLSCGSEPWSYHYEEDNYKPASQIKSTEIAQNSFLKLSLPFNLSELGKLQQNCIETFDLYMKILSS